MSGRNRRRLLLTVVLVVALAGSSDAAAKIIKRAVKKACADTALRIPDGPEAGDFVSAIVRTGNTRKDCPATLVCGYGGIPLGSLVRDVDVKLRVNHASVSDLNVLVVDPTGILTTLSASGGAGGANFGAGGEGCQGKFTVLDDGAPFGLAEAGSPAPFVGRFRPEQPLALHNRTYGAGDWRFYFDDVVPGGSGVVEAIGIRLSYRYVVIRRRGGP